MPETLPRADLLETIVAATRRIVEGREAAMPFAELERCAAATRAAAGAFRRALTSGTSPRVIAECKRRSPSRGVLRRDYDAAAIARSYAEAGAAAVSVLTEPTFFDGALEHLGAVRAAVTVPILRKDFIVTEYQLLEARAAGADAVLLIVAAFESARGGSTPPMGLRGPAFRGPALRDPELRSRHRPSLRALIERARELALDALVEVHDEEELRHALDAGAEIIGVNNRNLRTLEVDLDLTRALARLIPAGVVKVGESGLRTRDDIGSLTAAGYDAFLVGERLMTAPDPGAALRQLIGS